MEITFNIHMKIKVFGPPKYKQNINKSNQGRRWDISFYKNSKTMKAEFYEDSVNEKKEDMLYDNDVIFRHFDDTKQTDKL